MSIDDSSREINRGIFSIPLQVIGLYASDGSLDIRGSYLALKELGETVLSNTENIAKFTLTVPKDLSPTPYDGFITEIHLILENDGVLLKIEVKDCKVIVRGSRENFGILAENILFLANGSGSSHVGNHIHIEHYSDDSYLDPTSEPLVLSVRE